MGTESRWSSSGGECFSRSGGDGIGGGVFDCGGEGSGGGDDEMRCSDYCLQSPVTLPGT